jgi:hypothetical protein
LLSALPGIWIAGFGVGVALIAADSVGSTIVLAGPVCAVAVASATAVRAGVLVAGEFAFAVFTSRPVYTLLALFTTGSTGIPFTSTDTSTILTTSVARVRTTLRRLYTLPLLADLSALAFFADIASDTASGVSISGKALLTSVRGETSVTGRFSANLGRFSLLYIWRRRVFRIIVVRIRLRHVTAVRATDLIARTILISNTAARRDTAPLLTDLTDIAVIFALTCRPLVRCIRRSFLDIRRTTNH